MNYVFGGHWKLENKITSGSFGEVFRGKSIDTNEEVAIKLESIAAKHNQILMESTILLRLQDQPGFPKVKWYGSKGSFNVLVMDLLGNSIQELFIMSKKTFSLKTVLMIAEQAISRIESLHSLNWMHRDIKPENFLVGRHNFANTIYMIDFGLAKRFKNPETKQHLKYIEGKGFTGNQRFCSNNALLGIEQSRRDDLESIGYMLIYLLRGVLPWEGIGDISNNKRRETLILKKVYTSIEELCFLCPPEFPTYMNYVKSLGFTEKPDYSYIKRLFRDLFFKMDFEFDYVFDWKNARGYHIGGPQVKIKKSTSNSLFTDTTSEEESTFKELNEESKEKDDSCIII